MVFLYTNQQKEFQDFEYYSIEVIIVREKVAHGFKNMNDSALNIIII